MKVIVTGGAGFIGSHLVDTLRNNRRIKKIIILDHLNDGSKRNLKESIKNKKVRLIRENICNLNRIKKYFKGVKVVYHLAAIADIVPSIDNPLEYINNNFNGTINVLEAMKIYKVKRIIFAASASCYGMTKKIPTKEIEKIETHYPYSFSKYIAEQAVIHWSKVYNLEYISLRLFNVYGLRSRTTGAYGAVIGVFLKQKLMNKPFTIVGNGKQTRDFVNVKDVAKAFEKASFTNKKNKVYNVGTGKPKSVNYLAKLLGGKSIKVPKRPGEPDISQADISKIKKDLRWYPAISFENGVKELLKNINFWKNAPLWDKTKIKKATSIWFKYLN